MAATWAGKICSPLRRSSRRFDHRTGAAVYASMVGAKDGSSMVTRGNTIGVGLRTQETRIAVSIPRVTSGPGRHLSITDQRWQRAFGFMDWRSYHVSTDPDTDASAASPRRSRRRPAILALG